jgi:hypothetical protein
MNICIYCETPLLLHEITRDHITPRSKKGKTGKRSKNAAICCKDCNLLKDNKELSDWRYFLVRKIQNEKCEKNRVKLKKMIDNTSKLFNYEYRIKITAEYYHVRKIKNYQKKEKRGKNCEIQNS